MTPIMASAGEVAPKGDQPAVCMHILDMGMENFQEDMDFKHKVMFFWELGAKMADGRPFMLSKSYTLSLHPKSALGPDLARWRGSEFTPDELADGLDLEQFRGMGCLLEVIHKLSKGAPSARIDRVRPLPESAEVPVGITDGPPEFAIKRQASNAERYAAVKAGGKPLFKKGEPGGEIPF